MDKDWRDIIQFFGAEFPSGSGRKSEERAITLMVSFDGGMLPELYVDGKSLIR